MGGGKKVVEVSNKINYVDRHINQWRFSKRLFLSQLCSFFFVFIITRVLMRFRSTGITLTPPLSSCILQKYSLVIQWFIELKNSVLIQSSSFLQQTTTFYCANLLSFGLRNHFFKAWKRLVKICKNLNNCVRLSYLHLGTCEALLLTKCS